jgi:hypothetical protein
LEALPFVVWHARRRGSIREPSCGQSHRYPETAWTGRWARDLLHPGPPSSFCIRGGSNAPIAQTRFLWLAASAGVPSSPGCCRSWPCSRWSRRS